MVVRIRLSLGFRRRQAGVRTRRIALMAWALGGWRLMADLKWTGEFAIRDGVFSHWQVWIALGIAVQFAAFLLGRYGRHDEDQDGAALG